MSKILRKIFSTASQKNLFTYRHSCYVNHPHSVVIYTKMTSKILRQKKWKLIYSSRYENNKNEKLFPYGSIAEFDSNRKFILNGSGENRMQYEYQIIEPKQLVLISKSGEKRVYYLELEQDKIKIKSSDGFYEIYE